MLSFKEHINELKVSKNQLDQLEKTLDSLFKELNIDIVFTKHFFDRLNDPRNIDQIKIRELRDLFRKEFTKHKNTFKGITPGAKALMIDLETNVNIPFVMVWDEKNKELDLVNKTIMRKKGFKSNDKELKV